MRFIIITILLAFTTTAHAISEPEAGLSRGRLTHPVSLLIPNAPRSLVPRLGLVVDPLSVAGIVGDGLRLNVGSTIEQRSPMGTPPELNGTQVWDESIYLDGQELLNRGDYWEPEVVDGTRLTYETRTNTWRHYKGSVVSTYGGHGYVDLVVEALNVRQATHRWLLKSRWDTAGDNTIEFTYSDESLLVTPTPYTSSERRRIAEITYAGGNARIEFVYGNSRRTRVQLSAGKAVVDSRRLEKIKVFGANDLFIRSYWFEYVDEGGKDCQGNAAVPTDAGPNRVRRLLEEGHQGSKRLTRCFERTARAPLTFTETETVIPELMNGSHAYFGDALDDDVWKRRLETYTTDLDRDGRTDLVVLASHCSPSECRIFHNVLLASQTHPGEFIKGPNIVAPDLVDPNANVAIHSARELLSARWRYALRRTFTAEWMASPRGFAVTDLDADGTLDFIMEEVPQDGSEYGPVARLEFDGTTFASAPLSSQQLVDRLSAEDLRAGFFADIDGNGFPDFSKISSASHCRTPGTTAPTISDDGSAAIWVPNPGNTHWVDMSRAQALTLPLSDGYPDDLQAVMDTCGDNNLHFEEVVPFSKHRSTRLSDVNGDGIIDAIVALRFCKFNKTNAVPQDRDFFSRVYFGTGNGTFMDGGWSPGDGLAESAAALVDWDGDGHASWTRRTNSNWFAMDYINIHSGFGAGGPSYDWFNDHEDQRVPRSPGNLIGDFNADGLVDTLSWQQDHTERTQTAAFISTTTVPNRISAIILPEGGRIQYGFDRIQVGADMDRPATVVSSIDGEDGLVRYVYSDGYTHDQRFIGFRQVERVAMNGSRQVFGFQLDQSQGSGTLGYVGLYTANATLASAEVTVRGYRTAQGMVQAGRTAPIYNPVARKCSYALGLDANQSLADLVDECWAWADSALPVTIRNFFYSLVPTPDVSPLSNLSGLPGVNLLAEPDDTLATPSVPTVPSDLRDGSLEASSLTRIVEYTVDETTGTLLTELNHGDPSTELDDVTTTSVYTSVALADGPLMPRLDSVTIQGGGVRRSEVTYAGYPAMRVTLPETVTSCGKADDTPEDPSCSTTATTYTLKGLPQTITFADGSAEHYVYNWCGETVSTIDRVGHISTASYGDRCWHRTTTVGQAVTRYTRDEFGRAHTIGETLPGQSSAERRYYFEDAPDMMAQGPSTASIDERGKVTFVYNGPFGRNTKVAECEAGPGSAELTGIGAEVTCLPGSLIRLTRKFYRNDGKLLLVAGPHYASDGYVPVVRTVYDAVHDLPVGSVHPGTSALCPVGGPGVDGSLDLPCAFRGDMNLTDRVLATLKTTPEFATTWSVASARYKRDVTASGVVTQVSLESPFELVTTRNGVERERKTSNRFGMQVRVARPGQPTRLLTHNNAWLVGSMQFEEQAPCVTDASADPTPCDFIEHYRYDSNGHLHSKTTASGAVIASPVDAIGRTLGASILADGVETIITTQTYHLVDGVTRSDTATDEAGNSVTTTYDGRGRPVERVLPSGTETWSYAFSGDLESHTDSAGLTTTHTYDTFGRPDSKTHPMTGTTAFTFNAKDAVETQTDADGAIRTTLRGTNGTPVAVRVGDRLDTLVTYDAAGRPLSNWKSGVQRYFTYDDHGRLDVEWSAESRTAAPLWTRVLSYDSADRVRATTIAPMAQSEAVTENDFDNWGRVAVTRDALGAATHYVYDVEGAARRVVMPGGSTVLSDFDGRGQRVYERKPESGEKTFQQVAGATYTDSFGTEHLGLTKLETTDGDNFRHRQWRDALGRTLAIKHRDGTRSEYTYPEGDTTWTTLRKLDVDGTTVASETRRVVNRGLVTMMLGPDVADFASDSEGLRRIEYEHTTAGRRQRVTTIDDETLIHYEAGSGLVTQELYGTSRRTLVYQAGTTQRIGEDRTPEHGAALRRLRSRFDAAGRVVERLAAAPHQRLPNETMTSRQTFLGYDAMGNARVEKSYDGPALKVTHTWSFDAIGQPLRRQTHAHGQTQTTEWAWRGDGRIDTLTPPSNQTMAYVYHPAYPFRLTSVVHQASDTVVGRFEAYNRRGLPTEVSSLGRTLQFMHDSMGRQTRRATLEPNGTVTELVTEFNGLGQVAKETFEVAGQAAQVTDYGYTPQGYLAWEMLDNTTTTHYVTDPAGNRLMTQLQLSDTNPQTVMDTSWDGHKLLSVNGQALSYDPWEGVTTDHRGTALQRSATGHIATVNPGADELTFTRDARHMPVAATTPQGRWLTTWDLRSDGSPIEQMRPDGTRIISVKAAGLKLAEVVVRNGQVTPVSVLHDARGSLRAANGSQTGRGTAFGLGVSAPSNHESRFLFHGMESYEQAPGVHFARHRAYDAETGRFLRPDPAGLVGGSHRTLYADANPLGGADPLGLWCTVRRFRAQDPVYQIPEEDTSADQGTPIGGTNGWDTSMTIGTSPVDTAMASQTDPFAGISPIDGEDIFGPTAPDGCPINSLCDPSKPLNPMDQPPGPTTTFEEESRRDNEQWCANNGIGAAKCRRVRKAASKELRKRWRTTRRGDRKAARANRRNVRRNRRNVRKAIRTARRNDRRSFRANVKYWRSQGKSPRESRLLAAGFGIGSITLVGDWTPKSANPGDLKGPFLEFTHEVAEVSIGGATPSTSVDVFTERREVEIEVYENGVPTGRTTWVPATSLTAFGAYDYDSGTWSNALFTSRSLADEWADSIGATLLLGNGSPLGNEARARLVVLGVGSYVDNYHTKMGVSASLYTELKADLPRGVAGKVEVPILSANLDLLQGASAGSVEGKYASVKKGVVEVRMYPDKDRVRVSATAAEIQLPGKSVDAKVALKLHAQVDPSGKSIGADISSNVGLVGNLRAKASIGFMTNLTSDPSSAFSQAIQNSTTSVFISNMNQDRVRSVWR